MLRRFAIPLLLLIVMPTLAQDRIGWTRRPREAVTESRRTLKPLMVWVLAATRDRDDDIERGQRNAMKDPRVLHLSRLYVPLRLSRSQHRDILEEFGLPQHANMMMSFVTPKGKVLDTLSAGGVAQADSLASKMARVFEAYRKELYNDEVREALTSEDAKPGEIRRALKIVREFRVTQADADLIQIIEERDRMEPALHRQVYETLAILSTKKGVEALIKRGWEGDSLAAAVLEECTPVGAEYMLDELKADAEYFPYPIYEAVAKACKIRDTKPERWWERADLRLKKEEVERVKTLTKQAASKWRALYELGG